jgi:hypothetical protein
MGVHLMGVHLMGVHLTGVHVIGLYLMGVHIYDVYFQIPTLQTVVRWSICQDLTLFLFIFFPLYQ